MRDLSELVRSTHPRTSTRTLRSIHSLATLFLVLLIACQALIIEPPRAVASGATSSLYIVTAARSNVLRYNGVTGTAEGSGWLAHGLFSSSFGITIGPNGDLFATDFTVNRLPRFNSVTGVPTNFISDTLGLWPSGLTFSPDGNSLYVTALTTTAGIPARVLLYNGTTGALSGTLVADLGGFGFDPTFGPDGNLYIARRATDEILRYNPTTGAPIGTGIFATDPTAGADGPVSILFDNGILYVSNQTSNTIRRYNATTGVFSDTLVSTGLSSPSGMVLRNGELYVANRLTSQILRFNATTGASLGAFVDTDPVTSDPAQPLDLIFRDPPTITTQPQGQAILPGQTVALSVTANSQWPRTYQWYRGTSGVTTNPIVGALTSTLFVSPTIATDYWVRVIHGDTWADSNTATVGIRPTITTQPQNTSIIAGLSAATLTVVATGTLPLSYQWYRGATGVITDPVTGATSSTLMISPTATTQYWVQVSNSGGSADSNAATVTVNNRPAITTEPQSQQIVAGRSVTLTVVATGDPTLTYQWYIGTAPDTSNPVTGATTSTLILAPATTTNYWVRVQNNFGTITSTTAIVTVSPAPVAPAITGQPASQTITLGQSATLSVTVGTGTQPLSYIWYTGTPGDTTNPVPGGTAATLLVTPTATTSYWARVSNEVGSANSNAATITVNISPTITTQPQNQQIVAGNSVTLTVVATGTLPLSYQWYRGPTGVITDPVAGGTAATLVTTPLTNTSYWVQVSNIIGVVSSTTALVTVSPAPIAPAITGQPASQTIVRGTQATLIVTATGTQLLSYIWYTGTPGDTTNPVPGGTAATLAVTPAATTSYWVRVQNAAGSANSNAATITVADVPVITTQPQSQQIVQGRSVTLTVVATGTLPLSYQWYVGSAGDTTNPIATGTAATLVAAPTSITTYWVKVSNVVGSVNSQAATVTVSSSPVAPTITSQPQNQTIVKGQSATLSVAVGTGTQPLSYQWYIGASGNTSSPVAGGTSATLTVAPTATTNYWVRVSNEAGSANSNAATVTVTIPQITRYLSLIFRN